MLRKLTAACQDAAGLFSNSGINMVDGKIKHTYLLDRAELFDERQFSLAANEAKYTDPQHRQVLEQSFAALHASRMDAKAIRGSNTGVAVGIWSTCFQFRDSSRPSVFNAMNISISVASGRVSFSLGLHGPSTSIDTACSSSLAASHSAARALQHDECKHHIVTGVNLIFAEQLGSGSVAGMTSVLGRCHSFDSRADGFERGESCSSAILAHGIDLHALPCLRGSAVQQDGRSASLTAPNGVAQARLLETVFTEAGVADRGLSLVEGHATGTPLGDPIEMGGIVKAAAPHAAILPLSATKANFAHSETGAGMTGLLAIVLAQHGDEQMPNAQLRVMNPHVGVLVDGTSIALQTQHAAFPKLPDYVQTQVLGMLGHPTYHAQ
jgi:acyl transferase domain-containing protein